MTKAQIAVWGLIAGLSVWGFTALSRVKLPDEAPAPVAQVVGAEQQPEAPVQPAARPAISLPATIAEFPFPDELVTASVGEPPAAATPRRVESLAEIPPVAIPQIAALESEAGADGEAAAGAPELALASAGEPPIPRPGRPMAARPVEAVPLSEVKTLYVVADTLNVRAVPSTAGPVLQKVAHGFAVAPRQQADEWIGFLMQDGTTGWMRTDYLSDTMPPRLEAPAAAPGSEPLNLMM